MDLENNKIIFERLTIKPNKQGIFRCPFNCGHPDYPKPKWKTKKGFERHLTECPQRPSLLKQLEESKKTEEKTRKEKEVRIKTIFDKIENHDYKIGDILYYVDYQIIKPIYEQRGRRMIKMRHEEKRRYFVNQITVDQISCEFPEYKEFNGNAEELIPYTHYNMINRHRLLSKKEECEKSAKESQDLYDEGCRNAALYR